MPAVVVLTMVCDTGAICSRTQARDQFERLLHFALRANNADEILHELLQLVLDLIGILARGTHVERLQRSLRSANRRRVIDWRRAVRLCKRRGELPCALAEAQQM